MGDEVLIAIPLTSIFWVNDRKYEFCFKDFESEWRGILDQRTAIGKGWA